MLNRFICWLMGHRRMKLVGHNIGAVDGTSTYQCPRCLHSYTRKTRKAKA